MYARKTLISLHRRFWFTFGTSGARMLGAVLR